MVETANRPDLVISQEPAECEFRVGETRLIIPSKDGKILTLTLREPVCLVKIDNPASQNPECKLPKFPTGDCPIALYFNGLQTIEETEQQLKEFFPPKRSYQ